jgi:cyclin D1/2/4, plant
MSPSLDYVASILLCSEDSAAVLDLEEEESDEISGVLGPSSLHVDDSPWALWVELPLQSDHCIELLLKREEEHLPMEGYAERLMQQPGGSDLVAVRKHAIEWIWKVSVALLLSSICDIHA